MSKTYNARLADALREALPDDTEFVIEADPESWTGYISVSHPNGAHTFIQPWARDKRAAVTEDAVRESLRSVAYKLLPHPYHTKMWQGINREAHNLWVAQTSIEL